MPLRCAIQKYVRINLEQRLAGEDYSRIIKIFGRRHGKASRDHRSLEKFLASGVRHDIQGQFNPDGLVSGPHQIVGVSGSVSARERLRGVLDHNGYFGGSEGAMNFSRNKEQDQRDERLWALHEKYTAQLVRAHGLRCLISLKARIEV